MADRDGEVVYSAYITLKNGKRIYAHQKGLKAFCFIAKRKRPTNSDEPKN